VTPRQQLDFSLQVARVAEVISTGLSFARSLGCKDEGTSIVFGFSWTKLEGRVLTSWTDPRRGLFRLPSPSYQEEYSSPPIVVPLETPPSAIAPHVENAVKGLFNLFGGTHFASSVIEDMVDGALRR
jgi:hypothetical protein